MGRTPTRETSSAQISKGEKNDNRPSLSHCHDHGGPEGLRRTDPIGLRSGTAIQRTRKRLQPTQSAAFGRDRLAASAYHSVARSDQGRGEQRTAVPVGRLADAPRGGPDDRKNGSDAPFQQTTIIVTGYTDNVPIGPELRAQGVDSNQQLSLKRAQTVANFLISQ